MAENLYQFRIVLHSSTDKDHYDLFIESDNTLITYEISLENFSVLNDLIEKRVSLALNTGSKLDRKADHRKHYWNYEGRITENRGFVRRVQEGLVYATDFPEKADIIERKK